MVTGTIPLGIHCLSSTGPYKEIMQEVKGTTVVMRLRLMATDYLAIKRQLLDNSLQKFFFLAPASFQAVVWFY